jgi:hypothetical protein
LRGARAGGSATLSRPIETDADEMARSKNKQKRKRHQHSLRRKRRLARKRLARQQSDS